MVTQAQRRKANADPIVDAHLLLIEFQEEGSTTVHRAVFNNEDIVSGGNTFTATDISVSVPPSGNEMPSLNIEMSNISRVIGKALSWAKARIKVRLMLIDAAAPNVYIMDTYNLLVVGSPSGDSERISASLVARAGLDEPWPPRPTSKQFFPGVWWPK